jgi:hypothetical protein
MRLPTLEQFIAWDSALGLRRTAVLGLTLWMTWRSFLWAGVYANAHSTTEGALVLAAVLGPIATLQTFVFRIYSDGKA